MEFDSNIKKIHARERDAKQRKLAKEPPTRRLLILAYQLNSHIIGLLRPSPLIQTDIMTDNSPILDVITEYKIRDISAETD